MKCRGPTDRRWRHRRRGRQRPDAERELAVEPRLDVAGVGLLVVGRVLDQLVEDLVELGVERGLVGKARELGQELAGGGALVAGQVEADLGV